MKTITNTRFDEERALYGAQNVLVRDCAFDGPADGESAFKEGRDIQADHCFFNLRYPFWHNTGLKIENSEMTGQPPHTKQSFLPFGAQKIWKRSRIPLWHG